MVESAAVRDIQDATVYPGKTVHAFANWAMLSTIQQNTPSRNCTSKSHTVYRAPSTHMASSFYLIILRAGLTFHLLTVVRVRSREGRRNRAPPPRVRFKDGKKVNPAVAAAEDAKANAAATAS